MPNIKVLHTGDVHLGALNGPTKDGLNLRRSDTINCMKAVVDIAKEQEPNITIIAGDLFNRSRVWADTALDDIHDAVESFIIPLCQHSEKVLLLFGTENHDNPKAFQVLRQLTDDLSNLIIYTEPSCEAVGLSTGPVQIVAVPGFDRGRLRTFLPGNDAEQEDRDATNIVNQLFLGLSASIPKENPSIVIGHFTVAGTEGENGNVFLAGQDVVVMPDTLTMTGASLACFGHIHRPQKINCGIPAYYCGSLNQLTFNDEPFEHGAWIHSIDRETRNVESTFIHTPERKHFTYNMTQREIVEFLISGEIRPPQGIRDAVVRVRYKCTPEQDKALNRAELQRHLIAQGAFFVAEVMPEESDESLVREQTTEHDSPMDCLSRWLDLKGIDPEKRNKLLELAFPIITKADDGRGVDKPVGVFAPLSIEVKNYRSYSTEVFDFSPVKMAMVTGPNGVGKSSLFMDAIADCLFERSRSEETAGWVRDGTKSGAITFTFKMGEETYRVIRTRTKSGRGTLSLQHYDAQADKWNNESDTTMKLTQKKIELLIGMDYTTFCSVALIRQDAYGLFLEAGSDQRMEVLSNLLDLSLYTRAQDISKVKASEQRKAVAVLNDRISTLNQQIEKRGELESELEGIEAGIVQAGKAVEEDDKAIAEQAKATAAQEQIIKLRDELTAQASGYMKEHTQKKDLHDLRFGQLIMAQRKAEGLPAARQAQEELAKLRERAGVLGGVHQRFEALNESLRKNGQTFYGLADRLVKVKGVITRTESIIARTGEIRAAQGEAEIIRIAQSEERERLTVLQDMRREAQDLKDQRDKYLNDCKVYCANAEAQINALKQEADKLRGTNCLDVREANCKFLSSAQEAARKLPGIVHEFEQERDRRRLEYKVLNNAFKCKEIDLMQYGDPAEELKALEAKLAALKPLLDLAPELERATAQAAQAKEEQAGIEKQLSDIRADNEAIQREIDGLKPKRDEYDEIMGSIACWEPTAATLGECEAAAAKVESLTEETSRLAQEGKAIEAKRKEVETRLAEVEQSIPDDLTGTAAVRLESLRTLHKKELTKLSVRKGGVESELARIDEAEEQAQEYREQAVKASALLNDYMTLSQAFGLDGIQYMIVRGIVPEIMHRSNEILYQMTGGRMAVDIRTEREQKTNKKEINSLEVWISSASGSVRPYQSHSGGEKVRVALAVTFGLADVKARRAGVQIGMLNIDEPPFLDLEGTEAYADALLNMANRNPNMKILAISHDPAMTARFPQSIKVSATENGSTVAMD